MEQNGTGESDSDGACAKSPFKRAKHKSRVWDRVAWFARRSRSRSNTNPDDACIDDEQAAVLTDDMDLDNREASPSPKSSASDPSSSLIGRPWGSGSSSSSDELFGSLEGVSGVKRSRIYTNSEVVEQNCLKPSVARALFHQLEQANNGTSNNISNHKRFMWLKKKKQSNGHTAERSDTTFFLNRNGVILNDISNSNCKRKNWFGSLSKKYRETSPKGNDIKETMAHCACCQANQNGAISTDFPIVNRSYSTRSLDRVQFVRVNVQNIIKNDAANKIPPLATSNKKRSCLNAIQSDAQTSPFKYNSLPNYFSRTLQNRIRGGMNRCSGRSHLPICDSVLNTAVSSRINVCECRKLDKQAEEVLSTESEPKQVVSAKDFKARLQMMKGWFKDFNDEQKNITLKEMLGDCELPQLHMLSLEMGEQLHKDCPPNCEDIITWLPDSLALYILSFLDPVSLCTSSQVCKSWYQLSNEPCLWRRYSCQPKWRLSCAGEQKQLIQHMLPNETVHWKRVFAERFKLRNNWLKGKCNVRTFEGHTQGISCVQFDDTRIVSGSSDKTIKVWNIRTNTPWSVQTLVGHSGTVRCLHLDGNRLVSGSTDKSIKVWDLSTQQSWSSIACKVTMIGHTDTVRCIQVDDEKVISGSYDKTLKVWDIRTGQARMTLRGHDGAVLCVQFDSKKILSGACDKTIKVWNLSGECVMTLHGHHDAVTCLQFDQTRIISGSLDCTLKFWDIATGQCANTIDWKASEGHTGVVRCLQADSWRVVSASDDRTLKVWNLETGQRLVTMRNHSDGVTCLQFNDSIIVSGSYDKTVKLWDFSCC